MHFDASRLTTAPHISATSGFMLVLRLLRVAPKEPSANELTALKRMHARALTMQELLRERSRSRPGSLRLVDSDFDGCWAALHMRIAAHGRSARSPHHTRAKQLLADLFTQGLSFLNSSYEAQWHYSETLLQRIELEGLRTELDELAGEGFVADVIEAHAELGEALGVGESEPATVRSISEALTALSRSIGDYGRVLAGAVDSEDPESIARFHAAMGPRAAYNQRRRRSAARARGEGVEGVELGEGIEDVELDELSELNEGAEQGEDVELSESELLEAELPELPED